MNLFKLRVRAQCHDGGKKDLKIFVGDLSQSFAPASPASGRIRLRGHSLPFLMWSSGTLLTGIRLRLRHFFGYVNHINRSMGRRRHPSGILSPTASYDPAELKNTWV
jgi:hypothetical protein